MAEKLIHPTEQQAFEAHKVAIAETEPVKELPKANLELMGTNSMEVQENCSKYRTKLLELPNFNIDFLDELDSRGLSMASSARRVRIQKGEMKKYSELASFRSIALMYRDGFFLSSEAIYTLTDDKIEGAKALESLKKMREGMLTNVEIAKDLLDGVTFIRDRWSDFEGKSPITPEMLEEAEKIARMFQTMGEVKSKKESQQKLDELTLTLRKSFAFYKEAYEELRRACLYSLYYEDGENLIPKLLTTGRVAPKASEPKA